MAKEIEFTERILHILTNLTLPEKLSPVPCNFALSWPAVLIVRLSRLSCYVMFHVILI